MASGPVADARGKYPALERQPMPAGLERMLLVKILIHHIDTLRFLLGPLDYRGCRGECGCPAIVRRIG